MNSLKSSKRIEIRLGGIGGQGVVYGADLLGLAASETYQSVAVSASFGAEARGTITTAEVVISKDEIDYPRVETPDYLILMHQKAYDALHEKIAPQGRIIIDSYLVKNSTSGNHRYLIPATQMAQDELADTTLANLILVGALVQVSKLFKPETVLDAYKSRLKGKPQGMVQKGLKGLKLGLEYEFKP